MGASEYTARRRRDAGFTLPELLVSIIVLGSIVAVLSSALIVTFQQQDNTDGRLNVSRAEQNVSIWIPADLASADDTPSVAPDASPCSVNLFDLTGCPANVVGLLTGSNALMLSWTDEVTTVSGPVTVTTNVSYHFTPVGNGLFDLVRIECNSTEGGPWTCEVNTVLHDLPGPPPPQVFERGVTVPSWVLQVSAPLPPDMVDPGDTTVTYTNNKNANRVVVTINGGGDASGRGGGINQISITAGGTTRNTLPVPSMANAPTFTSTQSRCGGPITLVVDESNSIGDADIVHVRNAVSAFITALAGTPTQIQVVRFHTRASILGDPTAWTKYYDMTNPTDVTTLLNAVPQLDGSWPSGSGGTNWEDAIFRTFYEPNNADAAALPITPKTVVFFTDGVPTWDRITKRGDPGVLTTMPAVVGSAQGWFDSTGSSYSQVAFNRADYWADKWRAVEDTKLIGVGVGDDINDSSQWMQSPRAGYRTGWQERSNFDYESTIRYQSNWTYQQLVYLYEQNVTTYEQSTFTYQQFVPTYEERERWDEEYWDGNSWENTNKSTYHANNVHPGSSDGWRRDDPDDGWVSMTLAQYNANNTTSDSTDGVRIGASTWQTISQAAYIAGNTTNDSTDGFRRTTTGTGWTFIDQATYNANNTTADANDGFRTSTTWTPITQAAYNAGNTTPDSTDGFRSTGTWTAITLDAYTASNTTPDDTDGFRRTSTGTWSTIPKAAYIANNTTPDSSDGFRTSTGSWATISKDEYDANNVNSGEGDGYRRNNPSGSWVQITEAQYNARNTTTNDNDGVRIGGKEYSPPFTDFENAVTASVENHKILARFISGNDNGVPWLGTLNSNESEATMFIEPNWALVPTALKAVALGECGATLTIQTKLTNGSYAVDPFEYVNTGISNTSDVPLTPHLAVLKTTGPSARAQTFDFDMTDGFSRIVKIEPGDMSDLIQYTGGTWSCTAGIDARPVDAIPIADSSWTGMSVLVGANEAVSCVHTVTTG